MATTESAALAAFLDGLEPAHRETVIWGGQTHLDYRLFLTARMPPPELVSSARVVVLRRGRVALIRTDGHGDPHVMPGGRLEPGETIETCVRREALEECGWEVGPLTPIACLAFTHLTPKPDGYRYLYPDFLQPVFVAEGLRYRRAAILRDGKLETGSRLVSVRAAMAAIAEDQQLLLGAALAARR
jgi:ADP-ribose pyrophosphatase YjhB (NUDIX family)